MLSACPVCAYWKCSAKLRFLAIITNERMPMQYGGVFARMSDASMKNPLASDVSHFLETRLQSQERRKDISLAPVCNHSIFAFSRRFEDRIEPIPVLFQNRSTGSPSLLLSLLGG